MSQGRVSKYQCGSTKKKPTQSLAGGQGTFRGPDRSGLIFGVAIGKDRLFIETHISEYLEFKKPMWNWVTDIQVPNFLRAELKRPR